MNKLRRKELAKIAAKIEELRDMLESLRDEEQVGTRNGNRTVEQRHSTSKRYPLFHSVPNGGNEPLILFQRCSRSCSIRKPLYIKALPTIGNKGTKGTRII